MLPVLLLLTLLAPAFPQPPTPTAPERPDFEQAAGIQPAFRLEGFDGRDGLRQSVRSVAQKARYRLRERSLMDWDGTAILEWTPERDFLERTGHHPENAPAAASPTRMTVWINDGAWSRASDAERLETMTHELAHLLIGSLPGGRDVPLWVHEGLAMKLAGQGKTDGHLKLLSAHLFGQLPSLEHLEKQFPSGGEARDLAYQMSYATIGLIAESHGDEPGEVHRLLRRMESQRLGPRLAEDFWDEFLREGWQQAVGHSLGSRLTTGIIVMSSGGAILVIIAVLAVIALFRLPKRMKRWDKEEVDEEPWAASLTDEDVQDVWGDREERWNEDDDEPAWQERDR